MTAPGSGDPEVGSVAEEAAKLVDALRGWASETGVADVGAAAGLVEGLRSVGDHVGHGQDCAYCPICIALNRLRSTSPEVKEHLATAVAELAQAATLALRQGRGKPADDEESSAPTRVDLDD